MASLLQQLPEADASLLMYLAGELPAEDRAEMDRRLAGDESLRAALDRLRAVEQAVNAGLGRLDETDPLPVDPAAAVRNVSRAMRQWTARPAELQPMRITARHRTKLPVWLIAGTAAAIIVGLGISILSRKQQPQTPFVQNPFPQITPEMVEQREWARYIERSLSAPPETLAYLPSAVEPEPSSMQEARPMPSLDGALADAQVFEIPLDPSDLGQP